MHMHIKTKKASRSIVGLKELREHMEGYIGEVNKGRSFIVVRRSQPIFKISPPDEAQLWEPVVDFTNIKKGGVPVEDILSLL
ncbi:hypothetical protein A3C91_01150 [Candidatus Azambacteria bacterium RIFCSPHIGHO2_02_FULL_52_12]|uniref:Antitoxin n=1 Tax=Candidatus Azambacteria bacterium RIFCSPLOWO2_01_FULL_46_25 TaxID=1797298 RepID=A0A1F5BUB3_9BACT|nr:MAG: hypothetical protein A3C91_01150 [Candidatus Azambacteria bacterium RIFCSPHIGHO2_02_FULL_52_12]OGD34178.1 MAG: hypothetical protein A2988_01725 [Candidatus Azambacteria bacterium RIFCSPLOWO2_01_FULL_46_25]OGD37219.1 MAG: hypothetical protein A2850_00070 [Candidatus Azambacteria bacterium RIFCSPHIGHO2_01_FULL_51_74]